MVQQHWQKAICKSKNGDLRSSVWCFWVLRKCNFQVQIKMDFSSCVQIIDLQTWLHQYYKVNTYEEQVLMFYHLKSRYCVNTIIMHNSNY